MFQIAHLASFLTAVLVLIWARLRFFKMQSAATQRVALSNDALVTCHILAVIYFNFQKELTVIELILSSLSYLTALSLFIWSIRTARTLNFATDTHNSDVIESGPYAIVRHPCYLSYSWIWFSSALLLNHWVVWTTSTALFLSYVVSARLEEKNLLRGHLRGKYSKYCKHVNMFVPVPKFSRTD